MDDFTDSTTYSLNEAILHVNLTAQTNVRLTLDHTRLGDELHALAASFTGHSNGDGIAVSVDGEHWVRVTTLTTSFTGQTFSLSTALAQAQIDAASTDVTDVRIKFQQYDNGSAPSDGREFDNIQVAAGTTAQTLPYTQDFTAGQPDATGGWEYYSDIQGRIQITAGRLRMDDFTDSTTYSLNEAVLHVNLTSAGSVNLTLDHTRLGDELHALAASFTGHSNGDGIAVSVDGVHWVRVTTLTTSFTGQTFNLDAALAQAKLDAASTDVTDVRIKFQQYDNGMAPSDGREFDNITVTVP
jgi:hypothetical protein